MPSMDGELVTVMKMAHVNNVDLLLIPKLTDLVSAWLVQREGQ